MIYLPIIKTRDAELRGVCQLSPEVKELVTPLFELTKSRKTKNAVHGPIQKRLERITEYGKTPFGIDLTSFPLLKNKEIDLLYNNRDGFKQWLTFLKRQKSVFPSLIPTLLMSDEGLDDADAYIETHRREVTEMDRLFSEKIYRIPKDYDVEEIDFDLTHLFDPTAPPMVLLDMGAIPKDKGTIYASNAQKQLEAIHREQYKIKFVILAGSSYPKDPAGNCGGGDHGENMLEEVTMFDQCQKNFPQLIYGDYATIYPLLNEQAGGQGWIPRIDFPTEKSIVYYRRRRHETEVNYVPAYTEVARRVVADNKFKRLMGQLGQQCWGINQIQLAAEGYPPGLSPSFWMSVRIQLHVTLQSRIRS